MSNRALSIACQALVSAGLVGLFGAPADAQSTDLDVAKREMRSEGRSRDAGRRAIDFENTNVGGVTYEDVLRDPDNLNLNFKYARSQVQNGNVKGAAATLERMLIIKPDLASIRLFYGIVLFRLDNMDEAERELRRVMNTPSAATDLKAEAARYLDRVAQRRQHTRFTATISVGTQYDSNRLSNPENQEILFLDIPITTGTDQDDFGLLMISSLRVDHDLESQAGHSLFGIVSIYDDDQVQNDSTDLLATSLQVGGTYKTGLWGLELVPSGYFSNLFLSKEKLLKAYGGELRIQKKFGPYLSTYATTRTSFQDFGGITENLSAVLRRGRQVEGEIGLGLTYMPEMRVDLSLLHFDKNAKGEFFAYKRTQFQVAHTYLIGGGQFLLNNLTFQLDRYDAPDPFVSQRKRMDKILRYRLTYGAPLGFFVPEKWLWPPLSDVTAAGSFEYFRSTSNIPNFDYRNFKGQFLLSKTWSF